MERPYIVCHMVQSIDGRVTGDFLATPACAPATEVYYALNRAYKADAFACGRVTMAESFTGGWQPDLAAFDGAALPREDWVADETARFFAVAFDRRGRLGWQTPCIEDEDPGYGGAHIVEVLCEGVDDRYLAYLRRIGVSYIFAGARELDLPLALQKLRSLFGIETLLLEGGSVLNGAFAKAGMIDELSLVIAPVTAKTDDKPLFWESRGGALTLTETKAYDGGVVWLNYRAGR